MGWEITRASARSDRMRLSSDAARGESVRQMKREEIDTGTS